MSESDEEVRFSEAHAYRFGQLSERILRNREIEQEAQRAMARTRKEALDLLVLYGLSNRNVVVIADPGDGHPVGTVIDATTGQTVKVSEQAKPATEELKPAKVIGTSAHWQPNSPRNGRVDQSGNPLDSDGRDRS
jgi:hypothetical protein